MQVRLRLFSFFLVVASCITCQKIFAQQTNNSTPIDSLNFLPQATQIKYIHSDSLVGNMINGVAYNKLIGNVALEHNGSTLTCDSAYLYQEQNYVEAFGNVSITTASNTQVNSEYLKYTGNNNTAILKKDVSIVDDDNDLQSQEIIYNVKTKIAKYISGATLRSGQTELSSKEGIYNGITKDAYFRKDVIVTDPRYSIESREMKYNTVKKLATFLDKSTIITDSTTIEGSRGTYDAAKEYGKFDSRSTVFNDEQQITANAMTYDKKTGISNARGNVVIDDSKNKRQLLAATTFYNEKEGYMKATGDVLLRDYEQGRMLFADATEHTRKSRYTIATKNVWLYDSAQHLIINCNQLRFNQNLSRMLATGKPVMRTLVDKDSLFIRADSFFAAPCLAIDTASIRVPTAAAQDDSLQHVATDTTKTTLLALGHVRMYSDSMQAVCDSMSYSQADSMFRLYKQPILWSKQQQAIADTIVVSTVNNNIDKLFLRSASSLISEIDSFGLFDQIYGKEITGYFRQQKLDELFVDGNAESYYFQRNEKQEFEGLNQSKSAQLKIRMKNEAISRIIFYTEPEGSYIPMSLVKPTDEKSALYKWEIAKRLKSKEDVVGVR